MRLTLRGLAIIASLWLCAAAAQAEPPANDDFIDARVVGDPPHVLSGTLAEATTEPGEPSHGAATVWFAFEPTRSQRVAVSMQYESQVTPVFDVFSGDRLNGLRLIGWADLWDHTMLRVPFEAVAGRSYRIAVGTDSGLVPMGPGSQYRARIDRAPLPSNDAFAKPKTIRLHTLVRGNVGDATPQAGEALLLGTRSSHTVWFQVHAVRSGELTADTTGSQCGPGNDVAVVTGTRLATAKLVANGQVAVAFDAKRGRTYRIAIDCRGTSTGHYVLRLRDRSVLGQGVTMEVPPGQTVAGMRSQGLQLIVGAERNVRTRARLVVSARTARRLGLKSRVLGSSGSWVAADEQLPIVIRLRSAADRAMSGVTRLHATARLVVFPKHTLDRTLQLPVRLPN